MLGQFMNMSSKKSEDLILVTENENETYILNFLPLKKKSWKKF